MSPGRDAWFLKEMSKLKEQGWSMEYNGDHVEIKPPLRIVKEAKLAEDVTWRVISFEAAIPFVSGFTAGYRTAKGQP